MCDNNDDGMSRHDNDAYDLKNSLETLASRHPVEDGFPLSRWSVPLWVVELREGQATLHTTAEHHVEALSFLEVLVGAAAEVPVSPLTDWQVRTTKEDYLQQVERVQRLVKH